MACCGVPQPVVLSAVSQTPSPPEYCPKLAVLKLAPVFESCHAVAVTAPEPKQIAPLGQRPPLVPLPLVKEKVVLARKAGAKPMPNPNNTKVLVKTLTFVSSGHLIIFLLLFFG